LAGASVQSTTSSWGARISASNAGYTVFRGSVKGMAYPLHSPVSPSLPLPCVAVCHHISTGHCLLGVHDPTIALSGGDKHIPIPSLYCRSITKDSVLLSDSKTVQTADGTIVISLCFWMWLICNVLQFGITSVTKTVFGVNITINLLAPEFYI
jgi:hypothetical protein